MFTSVLLVAFTGSVVAPTQGLNWQTDYAQAVTMGKSANKPLAVFIGSGPGGQEKVSQSGKFGEDVAKSLTDSYVCVYVDVATPEGQKLATQFGISRGMGLIISDRTGGLQAFSHDGDLSAADLGRWLTYGANPGLTVTTTMNNSRVSMYPNGSAVSGNGYVMYGSSPGFVGGGMMFGGGCPGGVCGRR